MANKTWRWAAVGKLPAAGDFIKKDQGVPLLEAFGQWMAAGFEQVASRCAGQTPAAQLRSWRFWAAADGRNELVCGLGRDSSDSHGRPYPLLLLGQGPLDRWRQHWDQVPLMLEETWRRMEYIAAAGHRNLAAFWEAVAAMTPPAIQQVSFREKADFLGPNLEIRLQKHLRDLKSRQRTAIALEGPEAADPVAAAWTWHRLIAGRIGKVPRAAFMGGTLERTFVVISLGSLTVEDFVDLWTGPEQGL